MIGFDEKVSNCISWKQLFHVALAANEANEPSVKGIYYSCLRFCSANRLNSLLHDVRNGDRPLHHITRNYGLRKKVIELMVTRH